MEGEPSPAVSPSVHSSGDSEWKFSAAKAKKAMKVGQGLGKKLRLIKPPTPVKTEQTIDKRTKPIKKQRRRKAKIVKKPTIISD